MKENKLVSHFLLSVNHMLFTSRLFLMDLNDR